MRTAQEIGIILGISERQAHRRLADREPVAMRTLKSMLVHQDFGHALDDAARSLEAALPEAKKLDPKFHDYINEVAYRLRHWQTVDAAPHEMERYWTYDTPPDRNDFHRRHLSFEEFKQECEDHEECRLEALAELRKKLTGSSEPPPAEPDETEPEPSSEASANAARSPDTK